MTSPVHSLLQHPSTDAALTVEAVVRRIARGRVELAFDVLGDIADIVLPTRGEGQRRDGLWKTTCAEMFVRAPGAPAYREVNVSPSSDWAAYAFDACRQGRHDDPGAELTGFDVSVSRSRLRLTAAIMLADLADPAEMALSAVIEMRGGGLSYWALAHPAGAPDFHHNVAFAAIL